jgi:hypothetical protein
MPACHQATGYRSPVTGDQALLPCSSMTQNLGARCVSKASLWQVSGLKCNENASSS